MSADTRIVVIVLESGVAFMGVLQNSEMLVDKSDPAAQLNAVQYYLQREKPQNELMLGLASFSSLEDALAAIPPLEEAWAGEYGPIEYSSPLVIEFARGKVRKMRPIAYA